MINLSHQYKCFLWLPPKTASTRAADIFKKFGFITIGEIDMNIIGPLGHNHDMKLFDGSDDYQLICTTRNPYARMVSTFKHSTKYSLEEPKQRFLSFLKRFFYRKDADWLLTNGKVNFNEPLDKRIPDYYIRLEYMYEDYLKIPFVKNTDIYLSGELKSMCEIKLNENIENKTPWRDLYDEESADMVYYNFSKYFELLGYDRNSYKK